MYKILKSYIINTLITLVFFTPIVFYSHFTGGHKWNSDDTFAIIAFGWIFGAFLKSIYLAFISTSKDAIDTIEDLKK